MDLLPAKMAKAMAAMGVTADLGIGAREFTNLPRADDVVINRALTNRVVHDVSDTRAATFRVEGQRNLVAIAKGAQIDGARLQIKGRHNRIFIGPEARLRRCRIIVNGENSFVAVGARTTWESGAILATDSQSIIVGNDCMFSSEIVLRTSDSHGIFDSNTREMLNPPRPVSVGHHVWLGAGTRVNKGAAIGDGSIVGQMSVVNGLLDASSVYAGVPARKIRGDVFWSRSFSPEDVLDEYLPDLVPDIDGA